MTLDKQISIRPATAEDAQLLADIGAATFRETYTDLFVPGDLEPRTRQKYGLEIQKEELQDKDNLFLLAFHKAAAVGFVKLRMTDQSRHLQEEGFCHLEKIYVLKALTGQGIGSALMTSSIDLARSKKIKGLWLGVMKGNSSAIQFYQKWKYKVMGEERFSIGANQYLDLVMALRF
jgi:ribosomal protein S18 acetylase RimI-like enzyme